MRDAFARVPREIFRIRSVTSTCFLVLVPITSRSQPNIQLCRKVPIKGPFVVPLQGRLVLSISNSSCPPPLGTTRVEDTGVSTARDDVVWAALADGLAGRPRVRVSRDRGKSYPARVEAPLTTSRPVKPAAVMVYGYDGTASTIFFDLDTSRGGVDQVLEDYRTIVRWLDAEGALWVEDVSPSGGRHIYVPLAQPVPFTEARALVEAMATRCRSLDPSPHRSVASGCCRVPGSRHKSGGVQSLTQVLGEAIEAVTVRNTPQVWDALWASTEETRAVIAAAEAAVAAVDPDAPAVPHGNGGLGARMLLIAREGIWDSSRYASASEARMAVIVAAARSGFSLTQVQERILTGAWAGLAGLYAKYSARAKKKTLSREWGRACELVQRTGVDAKGKGVRNSDTSLFKSQRGAPPWLESWYLRRVALEERLPATRESQLLRMVLRAIEEAATKTDSPEISFGVRALAQATGMHPSTIANHLNTLGALSDPLIVRTKRGRGTEADTWTLTESQGPGSRQRRPRKVFAVRPAFRELGIPAALVYEILEETQGEALGLLQISRRARIGRTSAHEALETLANWGLAAHAPGKGWTQGTRSLTSVAVLVGADQAAAEQYRLHKDQRTKWRNWLAKKTHEPATLAEEEDHYPFWLFDPGPDDAHST